MTTGRAVVVGGGIGGLSAALALHRRGWHVRVLERAASLEPVGAGISLWPNALRALDVLGVGERLRTRTPPAGELGIRRPDGRWLARSHVGAVLLARYGQPLVVVRRADLVAVLVDHLPAAVVRTGVTVAAVHPGGDERPASVDTSDGRLSADLVVAADGIRSGIRAALFPAHPGPRYAGYTAWRLLVANPGVTVWSETWGRRGERFAILPMMDNLCYCYATAISDGGVRHPDEAAVLTHRFGRWHDPIPQILAHLAPRAVLHNDIEDIVEPLPSFHRGRVALLGDAAHAMTPDLGQGGCQAIEDAVVLAATLGGPDDASAFTATLFGYTVARRARTTFVARRSRQAARLYRAPALAQALTARLMGLVPASVLVRGLAPVLDWQPPEGRNRPTG